jgi:hypothetical protein
MKINVQTINILKNFAKINPSIIITEGNIIKTISNTKSVYARAEVETEFNTRFAIYNLDKFVATLSLFNDPDLVFTEKYVTITDGKKKTKYVYASEDSLKVKVPTKDITLPSSEVTFTLTSETLRDIEKSLGILDLTDIVVVGDGVNVLVQAEDVKNPSADVFSVNVGNTDKTFRAVFRPENIRIIPGDYEVSISSKGISHFKGTVAEYWIVVESTSTFG